MAVQAVIGRPFTFQVLFVDDLNNPVAVTSPAIDVFSFSDTGIKQLLVTAQAMLPVTPAETGRYTYTYTIPATMDDGDAIYAEMTGVDPLMGVSFLVEEEVVVISTNRAIGRCCCGLTWGFIP